MNQIKMNLEIDFNNKNLHWVKQYGVSNNDEDLWLVFPLHFLIDIDNKRIRNYFNEKKKTEQNYLGDFSHFLSYLLEIVKFIPIEIPCNYSNDFIVINAFNLNHNEFKLDIRHNWLENDPSFRELTITYAQFKEESLKVIKKFIDFLDSFQNPLLYSYENFQFIKLGYELAIQNFFETFPLHTIEQLKEEKESENPVIKELAEMRLKQLINS